MRIVSINGRPITSVHATDATWRRGLALLMLAVITPAVSAQTTDRVAEILTALERRSDGLHDIRCKVRLVDDDQINLTKTVSEGQILFRMTEPNPQFLIYFDRIVKDGQIGKKQWFLFDGRWLFQANERIQQVTKQEMAPDGQSVDFFDLETAPFPLPFGHKKEQILQNFDVVLAPPAPTDPADTDHLVCTPKQTSPLHRKYDRLDFHVHRSVHLPIRIVVTKNQGDEVSTADFPDLTEKSINTGVTARDFDHPRAWKNYKVVVER